MRNRLFPISALCMATMAGLASTAGAVSNQRDQVLVEIGKNKSTITVGELEQTMASSPFATQFNTINKDAQAALRGIMLKRLVAARLLRIESKALGMSKTAAFKMDIEAFRKGLLYRHYMSELRKSVTIPKADMVNLRKQYKDNPEAFTAARSAELTRRYRALRVLAIAHLRENYKVLVFEERIKPGMSADTILLQGRNIGITYGDIIRGRKDKKQPETKWIKEQLYNMAELELVADAAKVYKVNVEAKVKHYENERLPAVLRERLTKKWFSGDNTLRKYYKTHPEIGKSPALWHIGQIVVAKEDVAKRLHKAIKAGASLFRMAGQFSIDPYGKSKNGDMGWIRQGKGHPDIEKALSKLKSGEVSDIIKTSKGYHIVTILGMREGKKSSFESIKDKIKQTFIDEKMTKYLSILQSKYNVIWKVLGQKKNGTNGKS